ncbi:ABC transporter permease [Isoptericola sp. NPDC057559]|uniref:ABC transporter permease n=1 Tax=Isoptericola sp. NPDC057559 TaxID=3346168 RepID=UPI0036B1B604
MKSLDIVRTALRNAFRSKLRTTLTVLAIFIGAFTLSLTNGIGTGINGFVESTVASIGVDDVMTVTKSTEQTEASEGPAEYDPNQLEAGAGGAAGAPGAAGGGGGSVAMTEDDIDQITDIDGVLRVEPTENVSVDYIQLGDGTQYQLSLSQFVPGMEVELAAGEQINLDADDPQIVLPESYIEPLGFDNAAAAIGHEITLAVTDGDGQQVTSEATVVGVAEPGLVSSSGAIPNTTLTSNLYELQQTGAPAAQGDTYASASVWFDPDAGDEATAALKDRLADDGYTATTLEDQLGSITSVIDTVVLVLNGFAIIALLAASIGIVNTLFMAVQERTREVGLMKAMGLSSAKVFSLFSIEAVVIGFLGSALGAIAAIGVGQIVGATLSSTILADLPGLTLIAFEPVTVAAVILGVMAVAFLAGTLPALRAAKQDPISSLRYE